MNQPSAAGGPVRPNQAPSPSGTMSGGDEPRKIRTFTVKPDQADSAATPTRAAPAAAARTAAPPATASTRTPSPVANANASTNAPLSLSPQAADTPAPRPARVASTTPAAQPAASSAAAGGGYVVQVSSQRSEADAQASYRSLQGKFPSVLGSHPPLIKRADLGEKGVYYRAMVGPFGSPDEASQLCGSLKTAGGQCVVQRN
jgi:cell division septation protein DedD